MPTYDVVFVDSITANPTVRLDVRSAGWTVRPGTSFAPPPLERAVASTLMYDGESYPATAYGNRTITLVLRIDGASDDVIAGRMQQLMRELDRPTNILRYRPDTSSPVFFRTFRAGPDSVVWDPFTKEVTVQVPAEPFGLGLKETIGPTTVNNDPAAGSNGQYVDLTGIKGDVETPLRITVPQSGGLVDPNDMSLFALRRRGTPSLAPYLLQAEAMTQGTDTTTQSTAEDASGTGNKWSRTTFATQAILAAGRLSATWPATTGADLRGRYRVFARCRTTNGGDEIYASITLGNGVINSEVLVPSNAATSWQLIDLGLMSIPLGADPVTDSTTGGPLTAKGVAISVAARRPNGLGNLDWDYLLAVPADDRLGIIAWGAPSVVSGGSMVIDGLAEAVYAVDGSGVIYGSASYPSITAWPVASPGVTNRLYWLRSLLNDSVSTSTAVTVEYLPRYLYARPATS